MSAEELDELTIRGAIKGGRQGAVGGVMLKSSSGANLTDLATTDSAEGSSSQNSGGGSGDDGKGDDR